jgi:hypothetical protein
MTQYILNVTTKEWLKHLLISFFGKFKKYQGFTDEAHCGCMVQYFEYSHHMPSWEIANTLFSVFQKNPLCSGSGNCWYSGYETTMYYAYTGSVQGTLSLVSRRTLIRLFDWTRTRLGWRDSLME